MGELFLAVCAIGGIVITAWTDRYWSRDATGFGAKLPWLFERVPEMLRHELARAPGRGLLEAPAIVAWAFGPFVGPAIVLACQLLALGIARRRRWALAVTALLAVAALPAAYGGSLVLHGLEDRRFYAKSPYVHHYHALAAVMLGGALLLLGVAVVDGVLRLRRK